MDFGKILSKNFFLLQNNCNFFVSKKYTETFDYERHTDLKPRWLYRMKIIIPEDSSSINNFDKLLAQETTLLMKYLKLS